MLFPAPAEEAQIFSSSEKDQCEIATFSINPQVAPVDSWKTPLFHTGDLKPEDFHECVISSTNVSDRVRCHEDMQVRSSREHTESRMATTTGGNVG